MELQAWPVILAVLAAALPTLFLVLFIYSYAKKLWRKYFVTDPELAPIDRRDAALKRSAHMASLWRSSIPLRAFQWSEHPSHVITALEHGWASFAFSYAASAMGAFAGPVHQMWEMCNSCSSMKFCAPEITWTSLNSPGECLQQVRLNPGLRSNKDGCVLPVQALQTALPLPGPVLGPCPYPQDAYFELSILASGNELSSEHSSLAGSERVKLIAQALTSERYQRGQNLTDFNDTKFCRKLDTQLTSNGDLENEKNLSSKNLTGSENEQEGGVESSGEDKIDWDELLSVGLAGAEAPPFRLLGFDPGSVGFLSADGQCYVNGMPHTQGKDLMPTKGRPWGAVKTTLGCGFDPRVKRVYFTVNGELVHEVFLKSGDFGNPLYPTIASNYDVTVLINLGQRTFEYVPANISRVANPCCRILQARPSKNGSFFDDDISTDLFSMGRFDSHWLSDLEYANSQELQHRHDHSEAESDLFEIVLDGHSLKR